MNSPKKACVVLLSGGQNSTSCLAWAKTKFLNVHAITFSYGQTHSRELLAATKVADIVGVASHIVIKLNNDILIGTSPLINKSYEIKKDKDAYSLLKKGDTTFIPGRDLLFLTIAANRAYALKTTDIILGVSKFDCDQGCDLTSMFLTEASKAIVLAVYGRAVNFIIHAPLLRKTKSQIMCFAKGLGSIPLMRFTHSCYSNSFPPCMFCQACLLREIGFKEAGLKDPLLEEKEDPLI